MQKLSDENVCVHCQYIAGEGQSFQSGSEQELCNMTKNNPMLQDINLQIKDIVDLTNVFL